MTQQTTNETTELLPCAHCAAHLEPFGPDQANHPRNDCWLSSVKVERAEFAAWNRRAALPPTSGEAVNLWALIDAYADHRAEYQRSTARHLAKTQRDNVEHAKVELVAALANLASQVRECNACDWKGVTDRMCGSVGPLCPECGETTEVSAKSAAPAAPVADTGAVELGWLPAWAVAQLKGEMGGASEWGINTHIYKGNEVPDCVAIYAAPASPAPTADSAADARDAARWRYVRDTETLETAVWEALEGTDCAPDGVLDKERYARGMDDAVDRAIAAMSTNTGEGEG